MFAYEFVWIAFISGALLGIGSAFLSPFLVLSNKSLIADGLSHTSFTGIIIGLIFSNQPIWIALVFTVLASLLITFVSKRLKTGGDTAIGMIGTVSMAIGFIIVSVREGFNQSIETLLVGNIFTISYLEVGLIVGIVVLIVLYVLLLYPKLISSLYDHEFAKFQKIKVDLNDYILSILIALLVVVGVKAVGILLMSSLVIFPTLIARNFSTSFKQNLFIGVGISVVTIIIGIIIAHYLEVPAAATIVCLYGIILIFSFIFGKLTRRKSNAAN